MFSAKSECRHTQKNKMKISRNTVFLLVLVALLPLMLLRDVTPDNELRYLSIADEALRTHTFFAFTNHGAAYADKPPLYLWIVMACRWLMGSHQVWLLSAFSVIPALLVARTMDAWVARELGARERTTALLLLLTCGLFLGAAVVLRMDMLMCLFIVLALREFWRMYKVDESVEDKDRRTRWLFPLWLFLAVFTKGPLGLLVPLSATVVFLMVKGQLYTIGRYWGWRTWAVLLSGCALWFGLVYMEGGTAYLKNLLVHQTVGRAVNSFHHSEPFWYYAPVFFYVLAPWSLLVLLGLGAASCRRFLRSDLQRFFLVVSLTTIVLLSLISSKIQIYLLPALPFMVYAAALVLPYMKECRGTRWAVGLPALALALVLPTLFMLNRLTELPYIHTWQLATSAYVFTVSGLLALYLLWQKGLHEALQAMAVGVLAGVFVASFGMTRLNPSIGYGNVCRKASELSCVHPCAGICVWRMRRAENMDVYLQKPFRILSEEQVPKPQRETLLLVPAKELKHFKGCKVHEVGKYSIVEF